MSEYKQYIEPYQDSPGGLLEALHALRKEYNHIPPKALKELARTFGITDSQVYGVASFYSYLNFDEKGEHTIRVCKSLPCYLAGAEELMRVLAENLEIKAGSGPEGNYSLEWTECIGQCQGAPAVLINNSPMEKASLEKITTFLLPEETNL